MQIGKPKPVKITKTKKRKKTSERKKIEKKLDVICREIVLERDGHCVCMAPNNGHSQVLQPGHLITRAKKSVRWSLMNVHAQCSSCNFLHEHYPHRFISWFIGRFSAEQYSDLCKAAEEVVKLQDYELQELLDQLEKIKLLQAMKKLAGVPWYPYFTQKEIISGAWNK